MGNTGDGMELALTPHTPQLLSEDSILSPEALEFIAEWRNSSPFVVAHTSGSTGTPKVIHLLKSDMIASARATNSFFGINRDSTLYLPLSTSYIAGKMQVVRAIEAGCRLLVEYPSNDPLSYDFTGEINLLPIVPSQIPGLLKSKSLHKVRHLIIGGAPITPESESLVLEAGVESYATYGMTETCSHVALRKLGTDLFRALPGFRFSLDERGCLVVGSETMSFRHLTTNDIVELIDKESFRWIGRYDNVINSGGVKIFPEEVERDIAPLFPKDSLFYVTSRPSEKWGEEAVVVTNSPRFNGNLAAVEKLLSEMRSLLPPIKVPKDIIFDKEISLTTSKKIKRKKIL